MGAIAIPDLGNLLSIVGSVIFVVFFFGLCIFVHELGHFLTAKACKLHVVAFSLGFKKIWWKKIGGVEYRIGWIPFGGYVDLPQIDSSEDEPKDENGNILPKASPWARIATAFAGPLCNILFGLLLGCLIWWFGLPQDTPRMQEIKVASIEQNSPEYRAGLRQGDVITKLNGKSFDLTWTKFVQGVLLNIGDTTLDIERDGAPMQIVYQPAINPNFVGREKFAYPFFLPEVPVIIFPEKDSIARKAGLLPGDRILEVNGEKISNLDDFMGILNITAEKELTLLIERGNEQKQIQITPGKQVFKDGKAPPLEYLLGITFNSASDENQGEVRSVSVGYPANGVLESGDVILSVNGKSVTTYEEIRKEIQDAGETPVNLLVRRGDKTFETTLTPVKTNYGTIGVSYQFYDYPNPLKQFTETMELSWKSLRGVFTGLRNKLGFSKQHTTLKVSNFSGPVGIVNVLFVSVHKGSFLMGIFFVVIITYSLGVFNLLPIPVLDGGHIMLAVFEIIFRRPVPAKLLQPITMAFVVFLIGFMILVTFFDVDKMFGIRALFK